MSSTQQGSFYEEFLKGLQDILSNPSKVTDPLDTEFYDGSSHHKRKKREYERPSPLQFRYDRQIRESRCIRADAIKRMSNMVAWTWLPGQDRVKCPDFVSIRDPRLVTMDRFPDRPNAVSAHIGVAVYRISVTKNGGIKHGGEANCEMFKDLFFRPHPGAGGLSLDSGNETILRAALTLDWAMECVARGWMSSVDSFSPPQVYFGFNPHYNPNPDEWRPAMQDAVRHAFHPDSLSLKYLLSPGGKIASITSVEGLFNDVNVQTDNGLSSVRIPTWCKLAEHTRCDNYVAEGVPLADLPRQVFNTSSEVGARFSHTTLRWLRKRILDQVTEMVTVEEGSIDRFTNQRSTQSVTWQCIPSQYVAGQVGRASRQFLDLRSHRGCGLPAVDFEQTKNCENHPLDPTVFVWEFDRRPTFRDVQFSDDPANKGNGSWSADLMALPIKPWSQQAIAQTPLRGRLAPVTA